MTGVVLFYRFVFLTWNLAQQLPAMGLYMHVLFVRRRGGGVCEWRLHPTLTSILSIKCMGGQPVYCVGLQTMLTH